MQVIKERVSRKLSSTREYFLRSHENRRFWGCYTKVSLLPPSLLNPKRSYTSRVCCCIEKSRSVFLTWYHNLVALKEFTNLRICLCSLIDLRKNVKSLKLSLRGSDERQAQRWPDRLNKPRTGSVETDRLGRVQKLVRRPVRRKAGSVQKPGGHRKDIPQGIYLGVRVGAL